ncbi:MAG TPA: uroporphyrinogen decarboxylase family protein [Anaerolineae bacterium]|nr:uroporphyrinogen decarboxylase family protein [Anaerolineae bacterium]
MNSLERIAATIKFQDADRVPVIAQVFGHAASLAGVPVDDYVRDGKTLAQCQLNALTQYGYDAVFSVMDVSVETEAVGSTLQYRKNQYPVIERYALSLEDDWDALSVPDPQQAGRMPEMLEALAILRRELGNKVLVVGCVVGPFTLTTQLLGMETALYLAVDDPPRLEHLMDFATEVIIRFGLAQLQSGAHLPIVFNPSASPAVIPPKFFREFELPRLRQVFQAFTEAGAVANWLHIAGPVGRILPYYPAAGVDIANFDYYVSAKEARNELPATCLDGNIKSVAFVEGSPNDIEAEAMNLLRGFRDQGGFILSSGCEIPPESRPENVAALVNAARVG